MKGIFLNRRWLALAGLLLVLQACQAQPVTPPPAPAPEAPAPPSLRLELPPSQRQYEGEIRAFEQADSVRFPGPVDVLFTGSSSIRKWDSLTRDFRPWRVLNRGFGGGRLYQVNAYFNRIVLPYQPRLIVLYAGENDLANDTTAAVQVAHHLALFMQLCHQYLSHTHVLFLGLKPSPSRWQFQPRFQEANRLCRDLADADPQLHYLDPGALLLLPSGKPDPALFLRDNLHMNPAGYGRWQKMLHPWIAEFFENHPIPQE